VTPSPPMGDHPRCSPDTAFCVTARCAQNSVFGEIKDEKIAPSKLTVASFLTNAFVESGNSLDEIAEGVGCEKPVLLDSVLKGTAKLPVTLVYPIAKYLGIDPAALLRVYLRDYVPDLEQAFHGCGGQAIVTAREKLMLETYRKATGGTDPEALIFEHKKMVALALA
jgi:hypothetical protein